MRCGLGGLPPVVVTLFGRLGVGSNHHIEAVPLSGDWEGCVRISPRIRLCRVTVTCIAY